MDNGETGNIGYTGRRQAKQENTKNVEWEQIDTP